MHECVFCDIGSGRIDSDLAVFPSERVLVLPALRQRPRNRGHALVLPVGHVRNLHDAESGLLAEVMTVTARLTAAFAALYGANGSFVFQNNVEPDGLPFHLHVHAVPRFPGDDFRTPDPASTEVPRAERLLQSQALRDVFG
jgi:histidine triad (HIT) family protein